MVCDASWETTSSNEYENPWGFVAADCFEIGRQAYVDKDYKHCGMWMKASLDMESQEKNKTVLREHILDYLAYASLQVSGIT